MQAAGVKHLVYVLIGYDHTSDDADDMQQNLAVMQPGSSTASVLVNHIFQFSHVAAALICFPATENGRLSAQCGGGNVGRLNVETVVTVRAEASRDYG